MKIFGFIIVSASTVDSSIRAYEAERNKWKKSITSCDPQDVVSATIKASAYEGARVALTCLYAGVLPATLTVFEIFGQYNNNHAKKG